MRCQLVDEIRRVMNISEASQRQCFDNKNPIQELALLNNLYKKYIYYNLADEAKRLMTEIQQAGNKTVGTLPIYEFDYTIPQSVYEQAESMFGKTVISDEVRWRNFAVYFIPRKVDEERDLAELVKNYPLRYMSSTQMLDQKGRLQSIIGPYESDPEGNL